MIFHCLRHWVHNYHIDGFRFDLASILSRDRQGNLVPNPPMVELIAEDPLLADTKIIAEAWDAAGAYQVGSFGNHRWAEWNGRYRDDVRGFWRGDRRHARCLGDAAGRQQRPVRTRRAAAVLQHQFHHQPRRLHHERPGDRTRKSTTKPTAKNNRDGDNHNISDNYGVEGPTRKKADQHDSQPPDQEHAGTLLLSQGVPMLVSGDEVRRTQKGNNNAYCQDNDISWFDWRLVEKNADIVRFVQGLMQVPPRSTHRAAQDLS